MTIRRERQARENGRAGSKYIMMNKSFKDNLIRLGKVGSTNDEAFKIGAPCAVVAESQSAGRGRNGRSFASENSDGLWLSVLETRVCDPHITAWTAAAICMALESLAPLDYKIKWPNDIELQGKKLCGILTERRGDCVVIGIGINLYQEDFGELNGKACSLKNAGADIDREALLMRLLEELDAMLNAYPDKKSAYLKYYRSRCSCTDCDIWLLSGNEKIPAHAHGIDGNFELLVSCDGSGPRPLSCGEFSLRRR